MDRTRKANRPDDEVTLQYKTQNDTRREAELIDEKLAELQATIAQLEQTSQGMAELQRRITLFGECKRLDEETSAQFYDKLRVWLARDLPPKKLPLHAPRQTGNSSIDPDS